VFCWLVDPLLVKRHETGLNYFGARYFSAAQGRFTSPDEPFNDQYPADPQSWNLYAYVRNNPLKYVDLNGQDCVYTNDFSSSGTVGLERGQCTQKGGQYYEGTINEKSFIYNSQNGQLGFSYTNGDVIGSATIGGLAPPPSDPLPPGVGSMLHEAGTRASRDTSTFMISSAAFATSYLSTYAIPAAIAALTAMGETGAVGPGVGLLNKINHIFGKAAHNLGGLVQQYGSPAKAYAALEQATTAQVVAKGLTGQFEEVVNVGGTNVTVRGAVVNGVVKIGTAFKP